MNRALLVILVEMLLLPAPCLPGQEDYMGNNRIVVNGETGDVEQVTHYYPYGAVIGDLRQNGSLQRFKFEGKELDRSFGLDWYDIHARQYDGLAPGWNRPDDKAHDYTPINPYAYCAGDPANKVDMDGKNTVVMMPGNNFHIAMLIQNSDGKYQYYSINGKDYYEAGHCEHDNLGEKSFSSIEEFMNSVYNSSNYTKQEVADDKKKWI